MPDLGGGYAANPEQAKAKANGNRNKGIGSTATGYAPPNFGPFMCGNCIHFKTPTSCDHPDVIKDPKVKGVVNEKGCCNYFRNA